ncbi:MAG: hypothetical protein AAF366_08970 [Pseudomonadota bacterium]
MTGFVGIGMGAIQAGLFLPRAQEVGLPRTVLVRRPAQAEAIGAAGAIQVNIAEADGLRRLDVTDLRAAPLSDAAALPALVAADQIAVAVSSVLDYPSFAPLLAAAMRAKAAGQGPNAVIYASENDLDAADLLEQAILAEGGDRAVFQAVDTVIGKMSRTLRDPEEIAATGLQPGAPGLPEAWLVEAYDDIFVSAPDPTRTSGGALPRLLTTDTLLPFEQAKLNGHNAAHATLAYLGRLLGLRFISDVLAVPVARELVFDAFVRETGAALRSRYAGTADLFSEAGWTAHADALFARMANPWLRDDCDRVGRDTARKLGWNDRLVGTIRLVEGAGLPAPRWRRALLAAIDATGVQLDTLATTWRAGGAHRGAVTAFLTSLQDDRGPYDAWRRDLRQAVPV